MTKICKKCGQEVDDNVNFCPNCGERFTEPNKVATPPKFGEKIEHQQPPALPKLKKRKFTLALVFAAVSVAIILLLCIIMFIKRNTTVTVTKHFSQNAPAMANDSILNQLDKMAEEQMDEMNEMEREFVYGNEHADETDDEHKASSPIVKMIGKIDNQYFSMKLNLKDPGNIKGTGCFVINGKKGDPLQLLGILSGDGSLKISAYDATGQALGNFDGIFNGSSYSGTYSSTKSTTFDFVVTK